MNIFNEALKEAMFYTAGTESRIFWCELRKLFCTFFYAIWHRQTKVPRMGCQTVRTRKSRLKPMNVPPLNLFSPADWYRTILDQVQHEDNLIVQRLS
jgi:hypothetical protein